MPEGGQRLALRVTALSLRRFLGLQRPDQALEFVAGELSDGVTLIAGPNGSGKTTLARALEGVLWPVSVADPLADVRCDVAVGATAWTVELAGPSARWLQGGVPVSAPSYCPAGDRDRYRLSLHELLTAQDTSLATAICRELGGGYSLAEAAAQLGFSGQPGLPRKAQQRLRHAEECLARATREQAALRRREAELASLRRAEAEARQAGERLAAVNQLLRWREAGRTLVSARQQVALFDPRVLTLRGNELEQFHDLQQRARQAQEVCVRATAEAARVGALLATRRTTHAPLCPERLSHCRGLLQQLQQAESDLRRAQSTLDGSQAREAAARARLASRLTPEHLASLDQLQPDATLGDAVRAAAAVAVASGTLACFAALPLWGEPVADPRALEVQRRGLDLLRAWLLEPDSSPSVPLPGAPGPAFALALAGTVLFVLLAVMVHGSLWLAAVLLAVLSWLLRPRPPTPPAPARRPDIESRFARLGLALPTAWEPAAVNQCYEDLVLRWSLAVGRRELAGQAAGARQVLEQQLAEAQRNQGECLARNADRLGVSLDASPLAAFHLVTRIAAWQASRDDLAQATQSYASARREAGALLERLRGELAQSGRELPVDSPSALALVEALEAEQAAFELEEKRCDEQCRQADQERRTAAELADRCRGLLESAGVRPEEFASAENLLAGWTRHRQAAVAAVQTLQVATAQVTQCRSEARRLAGGARDLQSLRGPQLQACRDDLARAAAGRDQLVRDIESIETQIRDTRRKHDLEQHLAEREAALTELRREREAGWDALAGEACLGLLAAQLEMHSSGVLRRAQELSAQITQGRYRLLAEETRGGAILYARDSETGCRHDLGSLSSGTRVQLLLAARLAFIMEKEGESPMLPLVLDEVLGNSDEVRAGAIIDVVVAVARSGRQAFCFSAQQDEVSKWQARLAQAQIPFSVCWLPRAAAVPPGVSLEPTPPPQVPQPQPGETALDYARRLGVPALDRFDTDAGNLHLWYLVADAEALRALLQAGYRTWGQVATLLQAGGTLDALPGVPTGLEPARLKAKSELVILVLALLRVGHGRPLGRAALAASGLVTTRYLDDVGQLLEDVGGDAARMVQCLLQGDVKGFRSRNAEALCDWLREQGFVDERPTLSLDVIRARVHSAAGRYLDAGALGPDDVRGILRLAEALT